MSDDAPLIYFDHNATTPCDSRVVAAMQPFFSSHYGNAASKHWSGRVAERAVGEARDRVAAFVGASASEIIWTSGATESNNLAIKGIVGGHHPVRPCHVVTQATEHRAVLDPVDHLRRAGHEVTVLPVDAVGRVDAGQLAASIRPNTVLVSIMWANNETGTVQSIRELVAAVKSVNRQIAFHTDATQAVGKLVGVGVDSGVDLMSFTAHKIYGPKGCGALYVRRARPPLKIEPLFDGGGHERGFRSGTLNVSAIVGFAEACKILEARVSAEASRLMTLRDRLWLTLSSRIGGAMVNGCLDACLPNTLHVFFPRASAESIMLACENIAMSAGSACTSASIEPSHVLRAMGFDDERCHCSLRISLGRETSETEIEVAASRIIEAVTAIRSLQDA